jgi:hypothetical protein
MFLLLLGAVKLPYISAGTYLVKLVNAQRDHFFRDNYTNVNQSDNEGNLTEAKPDELTIAPELEKLKEIKYGSFKLGNLEKNVWFVMGKDPAGFYSKFYIDQNLDYNITDNEIVRDFDTNYGMLKGVLVHSASATGTPISVTIAYKSTNGDEIRKKVYFYLWTGIFGKEDDSTTIVKIYTVSMFQGLIKVMVGKDEKLVKFRLMDANNNGCFNDYQKDVIYMDLNLDGIYSNQDSAPLTEYFDMKTSLGKKQMRFIVLPFPGKVEIIEATQDFDASKLEPVPAPLDSPVTDKKDSTKADKDNGKDFGDKKQ